MNVSLFNPEIEHQQGLNILAQALLHIDVAIIKSRIHANLSAGLHLFYFTNKCDGLAKILPGHVIFGCLKVVKSLTIVVRDA